MRREEIDKLCDSLPYASWEEKQALWNDYKKARDTFWSDYQKRKNRLQDQLDKAYRLRRKAKDAEWLLDSRNRRRSLGSIIFAGIYLHRYGGSKQFDSCIEDLRYQQERLRKEAQEFKLHSRHAVDVLKTKNLSLEEYTDFLALMQDMAEDILVSGLRAVEYWVEQYHLRMTGTKSLEELLENSRLREKWDNQQFQFQKVDWTKL